MSAAVISKAKTDFGVKKEVIACDHATFIQRPEYERRAAEGELLLLSVSPPRHSAQTKDIILLRNWVACNLADVVFIGGAEKISQQWSASAGKLTPRKQKTFALAKRLVGSGIPVFTVDHPDNKDLLELGIRGYKPGEIKDALVGWGSKKGHREKTDITLSLVVESETNHYGKPAEHVDIQMDLFR